ncbi:type II toxin-antitoxin system PemK/MazF family toxin [Eisenbergiella sp.]
MVVSNDRNNENSATVEVVYLTTQPKTDLPTHAVIRSTGRISTVLCEQVHTVAVERVVKYIGQCSDKEMENIDIALMISLSLDAGTKTSKKYLEDSQRQQEEIERLKAENESLRTERAVNEAHSASEGQSETTDVRDVVKLQTERDTYKYLYENILERVMGGARA